MEKVTQYSIDQEEKIKKNDFELKSHGWQWKPGIIERGQRSSLSAAFSMSSSMASARYNCPGGLFTIGVNFFDDDRDRVEEDDDDDGNTIRAHTRHNAMNTHANNPTAINTTNIVHHACIFDDG